MQAASSIDEAILKCIAQSLVMATRTLTFKEQQVTGIFTEKESKMKTHMEQKSTCHSIKEQLETLEMSNQKTWEQHMKWKATQTTRRKDSSRETLCVEE